MSPQLHVVYVIDSLVLAGAESSLAAMAPGLVSRGARLDVIALTARPGVQGALRAAGATVVELDGSRGTWWRQVRALIAAAKPDLVHTTLFEANLAGRIGARLARVPVVSTLANEMYGAAHRSEVEGRTLRLRGAQVADAVTARFTRRLHSVSSHVADVMARQLRYPRDRIDVIPRGRDPGVLGRRTEDRRLEARRRLGIETDVPLVIAVARQEHQKGFDVLLDALPLVSVDVPGVRTVVVGRPGRATPALLGQLERAGNALDARFIGVRSDVPDLLCAADVFVMPSRREGLPGVLLEAMALECSAVVSDLPQVREVVDDTTAVLVAPDDPRSLARGVVAALSDTVSSRAKARAARERFLERYTVDAVAEKMMAFYRRVLDR